MNVRYKITAAFVLLSTALLAALCMIIYFVTASHHKRDFNKRLYNRALTVATLLSKLPANDYQMLSKMDSATTNLLTAENLLVYGNGNRLIYRFDRIIGNTTTVDTDIVNNARLYGEATDHIGNKRLLAAFFPNGHTPIVVVTAAINQNGFNNLRDLRHSLTLAFATGILLAFVVGWIFSLKLLKPLKNIATTVNNISANNIEERLPESAVNDEWNKLSVTFNNLLRRLQDSFELQGRFISNASHELSTPLTTVINQIDVTLQKQRSNEEYLHVLGSVRTDVQHMAELTHHLLTLARTARGGSLKTESIRIDEIIMDIPSLMKEISTEYNVQLYFDELPDDERQSTVEGNRKLLLSAFRNIAENGCKYAPDRCIQISLSFVSDKIVALFCNRYHHFDPAEIDTIFQPFQRGSNVSEEPGYGLGLSLTRRIILLHRGEIKAEIVNPDKMLISVILPSSRH